MAKESKTADDLFKAGLCMDEETGWEIGMDETDLIRAVQIWHATQTLHDGPDPTVGQAAEAFNVTPAYLADVMDRRQPFLFTALAAERPEDRILEQDGL